MTIRILVATVGIGLLLATPVWAQSSTTTTGRATTTGSATTTSFDSLSPGNQKIANALFSAQNTTGTTLTPLTKDQIAGLKGTEGWGKVFKEMKELSPNLGDGLRDQAAAVWDCEDAGAGLAATSIPSVNLTP